jgi:hypothetical protein
MPSKINCNVENMGLTVSGPPNLSYRAAENTAVLNSHTQKCPNETCHVTLQVAGDFLAIFFTLSTQIKDSRVDLGQTGSV